VSTYTPNNPPPGTTYVRLRDAHLPTASSFRQVAHTLGIRRLSDDTPYDGMELCLLCPLQRGTCGYPCGPDGRDTFVRNDALPLLALEGVL